MQWKIYTKLVPIDHGVALRWFWRKPVIDGRTESRQGFLSRSECEDDAVQNGYRSGEHGPLEEFPAPDPEGSV